MTDQSKSLSRREMLLKGSTLGMVGAASTVLLTGAGFATDLTPAQTEGPFYPIKDQADKDVDLTQVQGHAGKAKGEVVVINGVLIDGDTEKPISDALVEIWQACASGKYNHPRDPNTARLDPDFQYWAQVKTNQNGEFGFKTIVPGAYPASGSWMRPPHIHVKIHKRGYRTLTTQIYFADHPLNKQDQILQSLSDEEQAMVTVTYKTIAGVKTGSWRAVIGRRTLLNPVGESIKYTPELD